MKTKETKTKEKKQMGGKRPGAGRKATGHTKKPKTFRLSFDVIDKLAALAGSERTETEVIEALILKAKP